MITHVGPDWSALAEASFLFEDACWETCNSFCCSNSLPEFSFQLLPVGGTTLLYMEKEFEYFFGAPGGDERNFGGLPAQPLSIDFGGPRPLTILQTKCTLKGRCDLCEDLTKPLLCKLYPFIPVFSLDGKLEELYPASIYDVTIDERTDPLAMVSPCTVRDKEAFYRARWSEEGSDVGLLKTPYIQFYLQSAKHFMDVYRGKLREQSRLLAKTGPAFWKEWELLYLSGRLIDANELRRRMKRSYDELADCHGGDFL